MVDQVFKLGDRVTFIDPDHREYYMRSGAVVRAPFVGGKPTVGVHFDGRSALSIMNWFPSRLRLEDGPW